MSPLCESIEIDRCWKVGEQESYDVKPYPKYEGHNESQGYDYIFKVHNQLFTSIRELEGHRRVVRVPH